MIEARGVLIRHGVRPPVLAGADLTLAPGERVELLGRSGAGKSSLILALAGLVPPALGEILVDGAPAGRRSGRRQVAAQIGLLFQNPETQLLTSRVADEIAFGLEQLGWPPARIRDRVATVARELDLGAALGRSPRTLSGGEMQRVALAAAVAPEPRHLLLDEPLAHLDREAAADVAAWIERVAAERNALVVTAAPFSRPDPRRASQGPRAPRPLRRVVLARGRIAHDGVALPPALAAHLAGDADPDAARPELPAILAPAAPRSILRARSLAAGWLGKAIVRDIDLELVPGEIVTLAGPNGAGKSTLLATLAGLIPPVAGEVELTPPAAVRDRVSCALQFAERLFYRTTVEAELAEWAPSPAAARAALAAVGLAPEIRTASPFRLSGGELRRLALAAQVATRRPFLLLDEPGAGLDGPGFKTLVRLIQAFAAAGGAVLVASHDDELLALGSTRFALAGGRLVAGAPR